MIFTRMLILFLLVPAAFANLKIGTYNIRNFSLDERSGQQTNKPLLVKAIRHMKFDMFAVQEIRNKPEFKALIEKNFPIYRLVLSNCGGAHGQHVGFVYNAKRFKVVRTHEEMLFAKTSPNQQPKCNDGSRPAMIAQFMDKANKKAFSAFSFHLKSGGSERSLRKRYYQLSNLSKYLRKFESQLGPYLLMGDMNTTEFIKGSSSPYYKQFMKIMDERNLNVLTEKIGCSSFWWGGVDDGKVYPSVLDHVIASDSFLSRYGQNYQTKTNLHCAATQCRVFPESRMPVTYKEVSDHCPISVDI